jgi:hypothetical protein
MKSLKKLYDRFFPKKKDWYHIMREQLQWDLFMGKIDFKEYSTKRQYLEFNKKWWKR